MSIEIWGSDDAGHLMLMPDPSPERTTAPTPPGEPPLPQEPAREAAPTPAPEDDLAAVRRMIEEQRASEQQRAARDAHRDARTDTIERLIRGEDLTPPATAKPAAPTRPTAEAFESHEDYVEAVADYKAGEKVEAYRQEQQQERQQMQQRQQMLSRDQAVKQQEDAFVADHPDYVDVVTKGLVSTTPPEFRQLIMLVDDAPAVAYQIAQDATLRGRLLAMPPEQLFYSLGRLSAAAPGGVSAPAATETTTPPGGGDTRPTLGTGGAPPPRGSTPAPSPAGRPKPAPPRPLGGSGAGVPGGYSDDMSQAEYRAWRAGGGR